ncbi:MAG: F0F1 ATP synthase subunit B [bacterium]
MFEPNTSLIFWTVVSFLILLALLYKLVFPPLHKVLDLRRQAIDGRITQAEKIQREAETLLQQYQRQLIEAEKKTTAMFEEARRQTAEFRDENLKRAQKEAQEVIGRTREDIDSLKRKALRNLKEEIVEVIVEVNRRLIDKELGSTDHRRLIEKAIKDLEEHVTK